jgi:hypothetical protein
MIFFALACTVSSFSMLLKCRYLVLKLRARFTGQAVVHANINVILVPIGPAIGAKLDAAKALTRTKSAAEVKAQIEKSTFKRRRYTIAGFLALIEVRPVPHRQGSLGNVCSFVLLCRIFRWVRLVWLQSWRVACACRIFVPSSFSTFEPMTGALNVIYINRSVTECIEAASTAATCPRLEASPGVCDLKADGRTLILFLSAITVRACG